MSMFEIGALLERYSKQTTEQMHLSWEQVRWQAFINAKVAGSKLQRAIDLITFPWEEVSVTQTQARTLTPEEKVKLTEDMQKSLTNYINGNTEAVKIQ